MMTVDGGFADDGFIDAVFCDEVILAGVDVGAVDLAGFDAPDRLWGTNASIACWVLLKDAFHEFGVLKRDEQVDAIKATEQLWPLASECF